MMSNLTVLRATLTKIAVIFVSGPHCKRMGHAERQEILKDQYFFTCNCDPCKSQGQQEETFSVSFALLSYILTGTMGV